MELTADDKTGKALYVILYSKVTREETEKDEAGEPLYEDVLDDDGAAVYEKDENGNPVFDAAGVPVPKRREVKRLVTTVYATKATRTGIIFENVDTGLSLYPISWGNWERQKNQYHGRALVTGLIPNQVFINSMFATAMRHMQLMAFPKTVYNADLISNWTNEVGQAIAVHGLQPGQSVAQAAANLQPAEMSNQIFTLIDKAMAYTKECLGATDAQMGNVKPDNTSALMVLQTNSEVPLENVRAGLNEWVEDIGAILPDMMGTYYGKRPVVVDQEFEELITDACNVKTMDEAVALVRRLEADPAEYARLLANARTIVWNGPVGAFETVPFDKGSRALADILADCNAYTLVCGGDTVAAVESFGVASKMGYLSTGGGAFLEVLEGKTLPAVAALADAASK